MITALVLTVLLASVLTVFAQAVYFVTLTTSSPLVTLCANGWQLYYQEIPINAIVTGTHTFTTQNSMLGVPTQLLFYQAGQFNPNRACENLIAYAVGSTPMDVNLTAGQNYTLIATNDSEGQTGTYEIMHTMPGTPDLDSDGDGVPDSSDLCPGFDDSIDVDNDGIPDGCDPLIDSDGDGVPDSSDLCPGFDDSIDVDNDGIPDGCDPLIDSDGDGVPDSGDLCPGFDDSIDSDNDGIPDGCDPLIDSDGDGVPDSSDLCPGFDDSIDSDNDGIPDGCDPSDDTDSDNDGVPDSSDLCPGFDDSIDVDNDGIPDGCDPSDDTDSDNDGVPDSSDLCPGFDDSIDSDNDGIPDGCDPSDDTDSDNDGVPDSSDLCPGFDDSIDSDNDGIPDGCDHPNNNQPRPQPAAELPPPPPAKLCFDMNFEEKGVLRAETLLDRFDVNCRMLVENGQYFSWFGVPLTHSGQIGDQWVLDQGVIQAVDVFSPTGKTVFSASISICLRGSGQMISLDADQSPRVPRIAETFRSDEFPGYTCAALQAPATLVLVRGANPQTNQAHLSSSAHAVPLDGCQVTTTHIVRLRQEPNTESEVLARIPFMTSLAAIMRTGEWFHVVYLNKSGWIRQDYLSLMGACE